MARNFEQSLYLPAIYVITVISFRWYLRIENMTHLNLPIYAITIRGAPGSLPATTQLLFDAGGFLAT